MEQDLDPWFNHIPIADHSSSFSTRAIAYLARKRDVDRERLQQHHVFDQPERARAFQ